MKKYVTTKEIAKMANVSIGTVDRVIHNRLGVAEKTRQKVLEIMENVNYEPNLYARNLVLNKVFKIAVLLPEYVKDDYWELPTAGVLRATKEFSRHGIEVSINHFQQDDASSFIKQYKLILQSEFDAVVFAPVSQKESEVFAMELTESGVPYVLIDANLPGAHPVTFIGQNAFKSGHLAAKLMLMIDNNASNYIVNVKETESNNIILKRIEGYNAYFSENQLPAPLLSLLSTNSFKEIETFLMDKLKTENECLNIFIPHSRAYLIAGVIEKHELHSKVHIIGFDMIKKNSVFVEKGIINFIIHQKPEVQGYKSIESLYRTLVLNEKVNTVHYMPIDIITKENIEYLE